MQPFKTCFASQITGVRVGRSVVTTPVVDEPKIVPVEQAPIETIIVDPVSGKTRTKTMDEIKQEQLARDKLNEPTEGDENSDGIPDETQDIIHFVLTGGEKRSILRSDLSFAQAVLDRRQADFPPYAQRGPIVPDHNGVADQNSINSPNTSNPAIERTWAGRYDRVDSNLYPLVGDWLVEDWDVFTDKYIQKVYDNATFGRYFKASLN